MSTEQPNRPIEALLAEAGWLDALARRLVGDPNEADDIAQETRIAALKHAPGASVPLRAWLARVARNFAVQRHRSERARAARQRALARPEASTADVDAVDRAHSHRRLVDTVLELDEPYRSTVLLHYFDRLTVAEVSARQGVPESTVRTRLSRAVAQLRAKLEREDGEAWMSMLTPLAKHIHHLSPSTTATTATGSGSTLIGVLAMSTGWKIGAAAAATVVFAWMMWPAHPPMRSQTPETARLPAPDETDLAVDSRTTTAKRMPLASVIVSSPASTSTAADAASGTTTLEVRVRWGDDGTPASGVVVHINQWSAPDPDFDDAAARTDQDGRVHFGDVHAGDVRVTCDRGGGGTLRLTPGQPAVADVTIPDGVDVDGVVVDEDDVPVPDARILVPGSGVDELAPSIERTDPRGRFHLRDLSPQRAIAAVQDGHGSSEEQRFLSHGPGTHADVVLALTRARNRVFGFVHDEAGRPVAGAKVEFRFSGRTATDEAGRNELKAFPPRLRVTDATGSFSALDVGPTQVTMTVRARGFAHWQQILREEPEVHGPMDVRLSAESVVHGIVRDAVGAPVDQAYVAAELSPQESTAVLSRPDGTFRLPHLPQGSLSIHASADEQGDDQRSFVLEKGKDVEWNVSLHTRASVSGHVVDETGRPLKGWTVGAIGLERPGLCYRSAQTDADGRFTLLNWPLEATAVEVRQPGAVLEEPAALVPNVTIGSDSLSIAIPSSAMCTAFIAGRVFDLDGSPAGSREVAWMSESTHRGQSKFTDVDGRFRLGPFRPGKYSVDIRLEERAPQSFHGLTLVSGQELGLGDVHLEHGGSLVVHLHLPAGTNRERTYPRLELCGRERGATTSIALHGDEGRLTTIAAGEYDVVFHGAGLRARKTHVAVSSDHATEIDVNAEPGADRAIELLLPETEPRKGTFRLRVREESGADVSDDTFPKSISTPVGVDGLGIGTYQVEATTDTGLSALATLTVESFEPSMDVLSMRLH